MSSSQIKIYYNRKQEFHNLKALLNEMVKSIYQVTQSMKTIQQNLIIRMANNRFHSVLFQLRRIEGIQRQVDMTFQRSYLYLIDGCCL